MSKRRKIQQDEDVDVSKKLDDKFLLSFRKKIMSYIVTSSDWRILNRENIDGRITYYYQMTLETFKKMKRKDQITHILKNIEKCIIKFFFANGDSIKRDTDRLFKKYISDSPKYKKEIQTQKRHELYKLFYGEIDNIFLKRLRESENIKLYATPIYNQLLCNTFVSKDVMLNGIMSYIEHGSKAISGVGLTCKNLYLMVLMTWDKLHISGCNVRKIPILVVQNTRKITLGMSYFWWARREIKLSRSGVDYFCDIIKDSKRIREISMTFEKLKFVSRTIQDYEKHAFHNITDLIIDRIKHKQKLKDGVPNKNTWHENLITVANKIKCFQILPNLKHVVLKAPFCTLKHLKKIKKLTFLYRSWNVNTNHFCVYRLMNDNIKITDYPFLKNLTKCSFYYYNLSFFLKNCIELRQVNIRYERDRHNYNVVHDFSVINETKIMKFTLDYFNNETIKMEHLRSGEVHRLERLQKWGNYYKREDIEWRHYEKDGGLVLIKEERKMKTLNELKYEDFIWN